MKIDSPKKWFQKGKVEIEMGMEKGKVRMEDEFGLYKSMDPNMDSYLSPRIMFWSQN